MITITNKKAKFDFEFLDKYEAGIMLTGEEVKQIRSGKFSITDLYCSFNGKELFMNRNKLLLKRRELDKLSKNLLKGFTIVPYKIFENSRGLFKLELYLAKGKKLYDKRESIKERDLQRELSRK
jgi:SsrA-binding protein